MTRKDRLCKENKDSRVPGVHDFAEMNGYEERIVGEALATLNVPDSEFLTITLGEGCQVLDLRGLVDPGAGP